MEDYHLVNLIDKNQAQKVLSYVNSNKNKLIKTHDDGQQSSLLTYAICYQKSFDVIIALLKSEVDFLFSDNRGITPLMFAVQENRFDVVRAILKKKKNMIKDIDKENKNVFHYVVDYTENYKILYFLLHKSKQYRLKDYRGRTPISIASDRGFNIALNIFKNFNNIKLKQKLNRKLANKKVNPNKKINKI